MRYNEARELLDTARNREAGKPIGNNTRLYQRGDSFAICLHETDVVTIHPDDSATLDTGGWYTVTTKDRINCFGPVQVWSDSGIWYAGDSTNPVPFRDGMRVSASGEVLSGAPTAEEFAQWKRERAATKKSIAAYVKSYIAAMQAGKVPMPSGGDCWYCAMFERVDPAASGDTEHLRQHIEEGYYVPSLLINALREKGYRDEGIHMLAGMDPDNDCMGTRHMSVDSVRRALRSYMSKRLLPEPTGEVR